MATIPTPCYKDDEQEEYLICQHSEVIESAASEYTLEVESL